MELRTLRISKDLAGFEYQYEVCVVSFLGICTKKEMKKDTYDLTDITIRQELINKGFVATIRQQIK